MMENNTILISLIGIVDYKLATYKYMDKAAAPTCKYVVKAISDIFIPAKVFVAMTKKAEAIHYKPLQELFDGVCVFDKINIPDGKNETELWQLFLNITNKIPARTELIIDVTHGFRSQPMLLLSIAVYLQTIKAITVKHILYGAYDATDESGVSPLFDLKPFLDLIEWSFATKSFLETGNARHISKLLSNIQSEAYLEKKEYLPKSLSGIGASLTSVTEAFSTIRTPEIAYEILQLQNKIPAVDAEINHVYSALPFKILIEKIENNYGNFGCLPKDIYTTKGLRTQTLMIQHYISTLQYQQAITLARELTVTVVCLNEGLDCITSREKGEVILNEELCKKKCNATSKNEKNGIAASQIKSNIPEYKYSFNNVMPHLKEQWINLIQFRNDINHAAMKKSHSSSKTLIKNITGTCNKLTEIVNEALKQIQ